MDDTPTVEVSGTDKFDVQNVTNNTSNEVEMTGTRETLISQTQSAGSTEPTARAGDDIILLNAQTEPEPPIPAKKRAGFKFME
jgi:hypothetical protein